MTENKHNFEFCPKCNGKTLNIRTDGFQNGKHFQLKFGKWCKHCRIIFVDKSIKIEEVRFEPLTLSFGWGYSSRVSRSKKVHYFKSKHSFVSICGKEKVYNDMKIKFISEDALFKNQKCTHCLNLLELQQSKEPVVGIIRAE